MHTPASAAKAATCARHIDTGQPSLSHGSGARMCTASLVHARAWKKLPIVSGMVRKAPTTNTNATKLAMTSPVQTHSVKDTCRTVSKHSTTTVLVACPAQAYHLACPSNRQGWPALQPEQYARRETLRAYHTGYGSQTARSCTVVRTQIWSQHIAQRPCCGPQPELTGVIRPGCYFALRGALCWAGVVHRRRLLAAGLAVPRLRRERSSRSCGQHFLHSCSVSSGWPNLCRSCRLT